MGLLNSTPQEYYDGNDFGSYQFTSLKDIINQFMLIYVGEDKIIPKAKRMDVAFHAQRALAELSFDTLKSCKAQEIAVPASLQMILPQDYVNYTKISWVDSAGIKHLMHPASKTSNPTIEPITNTNNDYVLEAVGQQVVNSTDVVLTAEHKDIRVGMLVSGGQTKPDTYVAGISNSGGFTTINLMIQGGGISIPYYAQTAATLTFTNPDGSLVYPVESIHIVENLTYTNFSRKIIAAAAGDISEIKIGMLVNDGDYPVGTIVEEIQGDTIIVSNNRSYNNDVTSAYDTQVTFASLDPAESTTWSNYKSGTPSENQDDYQDDTYWPAEGSRFGLDPQHAQANGSFYIDCVSGKIHFSSNISGKTVILDYISDSLGTDGEMQVHKFAEEAMYKWISHAILSGKANVPEYQVNRFKKERFAAIRTAKLRLSNLKLEELTQILRGKSKQIKH